MLCHQHPVTARDGREGEAAVWHMILRIVL